MTPTDRKKLEEAAKESVAQCVSWYTQYSSGLKGVFPTDRPYVIAANPQVILELLAECERMRNGLEDIIRSGTTTKTLRDIARQALQEGT